MSLEVQQSGRNKIMITHIAKEVSMNLQIRRILTLVLVLVLSTSQMSVAIPIEPIGADQLDYLELVLDIVEEYYVEETDAEKLIEGAFNGVFDQLDQYSTYFSPENYKRYNESAGGTFGGIGITVTKDEEFDYIKIISPIEDTPGDRAGLKPNDLIIAVNGNSLKGTSLEDAVNMMRGKAGSRIRLTIQRQGLSDEIEVDIIREIIEVNPVKLEIREDGIANLRLKSFNEHSAQDVKNAISDLNKSKVDIKGLIIDLRNNPGGRLDQVIEIADIFLEVGAPIVQVDYRAYADATFSSEEMPSVSMPVAVLINEGSASASEILAGALQDNSIATIIGNTSFGKGTVQSVNDLANGGGIKLTIAEYLTANGNKVNGVGITPDVLIESRQRVGDKVNADFAPMLEDEDNTLGDVGLNVYGAQERLLYLGYKVLVSGSLNEGTKTELTKFQREQGITETGTLNKETRLALFTAVDSPVNPEEDIQLNKAVEILLYRTN